MKRRRPVSDPVRFLIIVVLVDVVVAAVLRTGHARDVLSGSSDWQSWLGLVAAVYLVVVVYAVRRVARGSALMTGALRQRNEALEAHAETTSDWLWEATPDLILTYSSRRVEDVLGYTPREVVGRDAHDFMTPSTARRSREALLSGATRQGWRDLHSEWLHAQGHAVALRHSGEPVSDERGRILGYRGTCTVERPDQQDEHRRSVLRQRVSQVLEADSITMALQPIIEIATGRLVGVEALARFADGRRPDVWFEEAGEAGLRVELEMLAVRAAVARLGELPDGVTLSVNACPEAIIDPRFALMLLDSGIPLSRVVIEVTEHTRIEEYTRLQTTLATLRAAGAGLAVDDTGAGYASLTHVLQLRPDIVKLDRSLVTGVETDRARRTLITSLTLLALDIGALVTAEGVETAAELEAVATLGVDHAQGYLIARPAIDLTDWPPGLLTATDQQCGTPDANL